MYQFLCIDANLPPPYLEIHWRDSANGGSLEEMDMEEMFDGRDDEMDEEDDEEDDEEEEDEDSDEESDEDDAEGEFDVDIDDVPTAEQKPSQQQQQTVFGFGDPAAAAPVEKKKRTASKGGDKAQSKSKRAAGQEHQFQQGQHQTASQYAMNRHAKENSAAAMEEDENDGLDIQSLSVVEAEFIYNKIDEGKSQEGLIEKKRTINLEAFKIIRVIGKGIVILCLRFAFLLLPLTCPLFFVNRELRKGVPGA